MQGLSHLHSKSKPYMVYSNIKATHILVNQKLGPKIVSVGLEVLFHNDVEKLNTFVVGTTYTKHDQPQFFPHYNIHL